MWAAGIYKCLELFEHPDWGSTGKSQYLHSQNLTTTWFTFTRAIQAVLFHCFNSQLPSCNKLIFKILPNPTHAMIPKPCSASWGSQWSVEEFAALYLHAWTHWNRVHHIWCKTNRLSVHGGWLLMPHHGGAGLSLRTRGGWCSRRFRLQTEVSNGYGRVSLSILQGKGWFYKDLLKGTDKQHQVTYLSKRSRVELFSVGIKCWFSNLPKHKEQKIKLGIILLQEYLQLII